LIRFSYRVVDADKANILSSKNATPYLIDEKNGLALQIPQLEQVGQLRQVSTPHDGREYWMAFSNRGRTVKPGDHVTVVIRRFRAEELVVEVPHPRPYWPAAAESPKPWWSRRSMKSWASACNPFVY
jgi:hypothetical protein